MVSDIENSTLSKSKTALTLHDELDHGLSGLDVEAVELAGLAAIGSAHLPRHVDDPQHAVVALHLHATVGHGHFFIRSRPQDDGLGFP